MAESGADSTAEQDEARTRSVWSNAARAAVARDLPMTVCHDGRQLRFHPDGHVEDLRSAAEEMSAPMATRFDTPNPALAKFDLPNVEVPAAFRELAETVAALATASLENTEATIEAASVEFAVSGESKAWDDPADTSDDGPDESGEDAAADAEAAEAHTGTIATTAASTTEYGLKLMEAACINASAMLEFTSALLQTKSLSEVVTLSTAHARKQIETVTEQTKLLAAVAEKMATKKPDAAATDAPLDDSDVK
jgi:hypothetical protein